MGILHELRISRVPVMGLIAIGLFWGSIAAWLPEIKARAGVIDAQFGALMMLSAAGGMTAMAVAPRLLARCGPVILPISAALVALVSLLPAAVGSWAGLAAMLLATGATMSLCDILANIRIAEAEAQVGRSLQNLNHAMYSLALAASAAVMGLLRGAGWTHGTAVIPVALLIAACTAVMATAPTPPREIPEHLNAPQIPAPWLVILPGALILWLSFLTENGTETWGALHIERTLGASGGVGAAGPAIFALAMGLARLAGQALTRILGEVRLIALSVAMALTGAVLLTLAPGLGLAITGAAALGLGVAVVVPTTNTLIARTVPAHQRASAISRAWLIGFTGFFIGPPLMGLVSQAGGLRLAFGAIAALIALMLPCLWALSQRLRVSPATARRDQPPRAAADRLHPARSRPPHHPIPDPAGSPDRQ
ncbi:MAG: MFS transporter [Paracoccus sp. (in: a-proteobacteria)]|uniref:MFS transporter n=1 Tax=Paracoccus sp. TaxID=267 RepID=UPI0026E0E272|nr:MFS transporter [Paracoccus sp. (in: a-proteobacteria)]MDO5630297.1 MFS transporter [Paracoccus sp. (in: a-proteobacteria)]